MTEQTQPTDAELIAFATEEQFLLFCDPDEFTDIARAVLAKWGTPAGAGEPFGYFHQLLNHEGKGNGVWLGAAERKVVEQAHVPGETSEEIVTLYTTPQPTQAQAGAVPLTDEWIRSRCKEPWIFEAAKQWVRIAEAAHGIKGADHVS